METLECDYEASAKCVQDLQSQLEKKNDEKNESDVSCSIQDEPKLVKSIWEEDKDVHTCRGCEKEFSLARRKVSNQLKATSKIKLFLGNFLLKSCRH